MELISLRSRTARPCLSCVGNGNCAGCRSELLTELRELREMSRVSRDHLKTDLTYTDLVKEIKKKDPGLPIDECDYEMLLPGFRKDPHCIIRLFNRFRGNQIERFLHGEDVTKISKTESGGQAEHIGDNEITAKFYDGRLHHLRVKNIEFFYDAKTRASALYISCREMIPYQGFRSYFGPAVKDPVNDFKEKNCRRDFPVV